jgi:hypothetical protein
MRREEPLFPIYIPVVTDAAGLKNEISASILDRTTVNLFASERAQKCVDRTIGAFFTAPILSYVWEPGK